MDLSRTLALLASANSVLFGYSICVVGSVRDALAAHFEWNEEEAKFFLSLVNSILFAGALVGSFLGSRLVTRIGIRNVLVATSSAYAIGGILAFIAKSVTVVCAARVVAGIGEIRISSTQPSA